MVGEVAPPAAAPCVESRRPCVRSEASFALILRLKLPDNSAFGAPVDFGPLLEGGFAQRLKGPPPADSNCYGRSSAPPGELRASLAHDPCE
jgi:hypothetical protein